MRAFYERNGKPPASRSLALALHGIEPATFERCAHVREWLAERGVQRMTLLVIPARDLHPLAERSPELVCWLGQREQAGDSIAQHGFQHSHKPARLPGWALRGGHLRAAEFSGLDAQETRRAVDAGWRVLKLAGIEPRGFVAPGYVYTPALRQAIAPRFRWWSDLLGVQATRPSAHPEADREAGGHVPGTPSGRARTVRARTALLPPLAPASGGRLRRGLSHGLVSIERALAHTAMRLDVHPQDLDEPGAMHGLERVLRRLLGDCRLLGDWRTVTYDELALKPIALQTPRLSTRGEGERRGPAQLDRAAPAPHGVWPV